MDLIKIFMTPDVITDAMKLSVYNFSRLLYTALAPAHLATAILCRGGGVLESYITRYKQQSVWGVMDHIVSSVVAKHGGCRLQIGFNNEEHSCTYPCVWLRDNCQCWECFNPHTKSRLQNMITLDPDVKASEAKVENACLRVVWSDGHNSEYASEWLWRRRFTQDGQEERHAMFGQGSQIWTAAQLPASEIPSFEFSKLISDDNVLLKWIENLEKTGLCLIRNSPTVTGQVECIAKRVAYLQRTNYGLTFSVESKPSPSSLAYTSHTLGLHTDMPFFSYMPGVQMLHCIKQTTGEGGDNEFVDGFYVAEIMKKKYPEEYKILTTVPVDFVNIGSDAIDFHFLTRRPVINLDREGNVIRINWNNMVRDSFLNVDLDSVEDLYSAMVTFHSELYNKDHFIQTKLREGDIVCFNNYRVLHGRLGYTLSGSSSRHLEGGYVDWDEMLSSGRVLHQKTAVKNDKQQ